ncbi:DUF1810 family protein [Shinella sp.]|uniref:DUF1810 family protein n=1 Tax=Shinella sp. TaxID=1870904 RepID=UPI003F6FCA0D
MSIGISVIAGVSNDPEQKIGAPKIFAMVGSGASRSFLPHARIALSARAIPAGGAVDDDGRSFSAQAVSSMHKSSSFPQSLSSCAAGAKRATGCGSSFRNCVPSAVPTAQFYEIASLDEAPGYLDHPLLAGRRAQTTDAVLAHHEQSAHDIFGSPDAAPEHLKFRNGFVSARLLLREEPREDRHLQR